MEKVYYVVSKQLEDLDGFQETNGWKDVTAYVIKDSELVKIAEIELHNEDNTETMLLEHLEEEKLIDSNKTIQVIQL